MSQHANRIVSLYARRAHHYDADRCCDLGVERSWLDRFVSLLPAGARILDVGCGHGEPMARYLIDNGFDVLGVDTSPALIALCRERFTNREWLVADMRTLALGKSLQGLVAWDSFFHLEHRTSAACSRSSGDTRHRAPFCCSPAARRTARASAPIVVTRSITPAYRPRNTWDCSRPTVSLSGNTSLRMRTAARTRYGWRKWNDERR